MPLKLFGDADEGTQEFAIVADKTDDSTKVIIIQNSFFFFSFLYFFPAMLIICPYS